MKQFTFLVAGFLGISLSGCGTYTPDIVEAWAQPGEEQRVVNAIVQRVRCEIREAVNGVLDADIEDARDTHTPRQLEWLESWGAQATLTLTVEEKTNIGPGAVFNTPMLGAKTWFPGGITVPATQSYSLGLGGKLGSTATRIDKISWFYPISEFRNQHPANPSCEPRDRPGSYIIVDSDLKIAEWLNDALGPSLLERIKYPKIRGTDPFNKDVISHQIKFLIETSGDITPTWRLVRITANGGGTFFGAGRSRTQDLTVTFGPTEKAPEKPICCENQKKGTSSAIAQTTVPGIAARDAHLASQIGLSVANNLNNIQP
jgi:hypothetical protein